MFLNVSYLKVIGCRIEFTVHILECKLPWSELMTRYCTKLICSVRHVRLQKAKHLNVNYLKVI